MYFLNFYQFFLLHIKKCKISQNIFGNFFEFGHFKMSIFIFFDKYFLKNMTNLFLRPLSSKMLIYEKILLR